MYCKVGLHHAGEIGVVKGDSSINTLAFISAFYIELLGSFDANLPIVGWRFKLNRVSVP
jgi:hypothetical protein